jgi:signal transduction histidine kinase/CheY-like chemotaxis protein
MKKNVIPIILIWLIITAFLLVGFGKFAHNLVEKELQIQVTESLNSILVSNVTALKSWVKEKKRYTNALANRPENLQKIRSVLTQAHNANRDKVQLQEYKEAPWLKMNLFSEAKNYGFTGFLLFDIHGNVLATNSDTSIENLQLPSELLQKSLKGQTSLSKPFLSTVPIKDQNGIYRDNWPTMLASTPIYDMRGSVLGVMAFRIQPETDFSQIINIAKPGLTGETYAVDKNGTVLLETRHGSSKESGDRIIKKTSPLTQMAHSLEQGASGVDVSGYSNFRGTPVVGAWVWVKELDLGLATEMEFSEAFKAIQILKSVLGAIFGLLVMVSGIGIIFYMRKKNNQDLLIVAKEKAEQENQLKTQCLSRMSHDFRSPMHAILGFTQLLESDPDGPLNESQEMAVEQISKAGEHLMELVTEILDLSIVESGNSSLNPEPCDVAGVIADVLLKAQSLADENKIELVDQTENLGPCMVMVDRSALKRVLFNLISNAILYNTQNGKVILEYEKPEQDLINISIRDTGPGIPKDQFRTIFRPFERLGIEDSDIKGSGIGLVLVKNLLEQMGGSLNISSTLGQGSRFSIQFPILKPKETANDEKIIPEGEPSELEAKAFETEPIPESTPASESKQNQELKSMFHRPPSKKILYILDNETNLGVAQQILKRRTNFELLSTLFIDPGIEQARKCLPDLILIDIDLPGKDGIDALKKLKTYSETRDIPVIALSAEALENQIKEALEMGFHDYIIKPVQTIQLLEAIDKILQPLTLTTNEI